MVFWDIESFVVGGLAAAGDLEVLLGVTLDGWRGLGEQRPGMMLSRGRIGTVGMELMGRVRVRGQRFKLVGPFFLL